MALLCRLVRRFHFRPLRSARIFRMDPEDEQPSVACPPLPVPVALSPSVDSDRFQSDCSSLSKRRLRMSMPMDGSWRNGRCRCRRRLQVDTLSNDEHSSPSSVSFSFSFSSSFVSPSPFGRPLDRSTAVQPHSLAADVARLLSLAAISLLPLLRWIRIIRCRSAKRDDAISIGISLKRFASLPGRSSTKIIAFERIDLILLAPL